MVIVRDGWGQNPDAKWNDSNAVHLADTPVADRLMQQYPTTLIKTSGEDVGLPAGVMGNSEVGHQNIGAGRIVDQEVMRITRAIREGRFYENPVLQGAIAHVKASGGTLHLIGLMSDGRVHSDLEHAFAVTELVRRGGLDSDRYVVHAITDGRDTSPHGGLGYIKQLEDNLASAGVGRIGSVIGRYYAMDRDLRWDRIEMAYRMLTEGASQIAPVGNRCDSELLRQSDRSESHGDEFITPISVSRRRRYRHNNWLKRETRSSF
ncbi:MAG: hypothetical protein R3C05_30510 [Pirellulaceae bacterium]